MAEPLMTVEVDATALLSALDRLPGVMQERYLKPAAYATAANILNEARRRIARDTGATARAMRVDELQDHSGYRVVAGDAVHPEETRRRERYGMKSARSATTQGTHVALWLEFGTRKMSAQPFFFVSARLEENAHDRRIRRAVQDAIDVMGLGD